MYKVGVCGHFGGNKTLLNGQTVKTKILTEELKGEFGSEEVQTVDTHGWKSNPFKLLKKCYSLVKQNENVIILPAHNGIKVFAPLFLLLNKIFQRKLHYVVIGGWLPELLESNSKLRKQICNFDGVYVETQIMAQKLRKLGLNNVRYLPNFKRLAILEENSLVYPKKQPYRLCTFSRVMKEKGIEDAIEAVRFVNTHLNKEAFVLDIYGQIEDGYEEEFKKLQKTFPEYVKYKGVVDFNQSVDVLKNYFSLLFPTYYQGEGFAGTILDAFASGVPVIATDWKYNSEVIHNNSDGLIYEVDNATQLRNILYEIQENPNEFIAMKKNCLKRAEEFLPEKVIKDFVKYL
jgi:glycosyltransferase involved in cell wall biosynthesis